MHVRYRTSACAGTSDAADPSRSLALARSLSPGSEHPWRREEGRRRQEGREEGGGGRGRVAGARGRAGRARLVLRSPECNLPRLKIKRSLPTHPLALPAQWMLSTALTAASSRSAAAMMLRPDSRMSCGAAQKRREKRGRVRARDARARQRVRWAKRGEAGRSGARGARARSRALARGGGCSPSCRARRLCPRGARRAAP